MQTQFQLRGSYIELNQLLKLAGLCDSGGAGKLIVASGNVTVDGQTETRKTCKVRAGQTVQVGDVQINVSGAPAMSGSFDEHNTGKAGKADALS